MARPAGLTVKEASTKTGYHPEHIRRLIRQGKIAADLIGQIYFIEPKSLQEYVRDMQAAEDGRSGPRRG